MRNVVVPSKRFILETVISLRGINVPAHDGNAAAKHWITNGSPYILRAISEKDMDSNALTTCLIRVSRWRFAVLRTVASHDIYNDLSATRYGVYGEPLWH